MRMEVAHHLADDLRALAVPAIAREAHVPHAVQHATMRRLEAIADVRQRSPDDHAHRVIHVRALHLVFDVDGDLRGGEFHNSQMLSSITEAPEHEDARRTNRAFQENLLCVFVPSCLCG